MQNSNEDLQNLREQLREKLQEARKQLAEEQEAALAAAAMEGYGTSRLAELIGYDEGGLIHRRIDWRINLIITRHKRKYPKEKLLIAISMPRGWGKSTQYNKTFLVKKCIKDPLESSLLFSSKKELANDMLSPVKRILENNPRILKHYGNYVGTRKWAADAILVEPAEQHPNPDNNYTVETGGVDANMASKRFDNIVIDDIIGKDNIANSKVVEQSEKAFKALIPLLKPGGLALMLFMRWGIGDFYEENIIKPFSEHPHFYYICIPDVVCDEEGNPLNAAGEIIPEDSPERISNYPEKFSLSFLDNERKLIGDMYWAHYRQIPRVSEHKLLDFNALKEMPEELYLDMKKKIKTGVIPREQLVLIIDNANTLSPQSNPWSISIWRWDGQNLYMLYFRKTKMLMPQAAELCVYLINEFNLDVICGEQSGLEANFKYDITPKLRAVGRHDVMLEGMSHKGMDKKVRVLAIQPFLNAGVVWIPPKKYCMHPYEYGGPAVDQANLLRIEMNLYPAVGTNIPDDLCEGFGYAPRYFNIDMEYYDPSVEQKKPRSVPEAMQEALAIADPTEIIEETELTQDQIDAENGWVQNL